MRTKAPFVPFAIALLVLPTWAGTPADAIGGSGFALVESDLHMRIPEGADAAWLDGSAYLVIPAPEPEPGLTHELWKFTPATAYSARVWVKLYGLDQYVGHSLVADAPQHRLYLLGSIRGDPTVGVLKFELRGGLVPFLATAHDLPTWALGAIRTPQGFLWPVSPERAFVLTLPPYGATPTLSRTTPLRQGDLDTFRPSTKGCGIADDLPVTVPGVAPPYGTGSGSLQTFGGQPQNDTPLLQMHQFVGDNADPLRVHLVSQAGRFTQPAPADDCAAGYDPATNYGHVFGRGGPSVNMLTVWRFDAERITLTQVDQRPHSWETPNGAVAVAWTGQVFYLFGSAELRNASVLSYVPDHPPRL